MNLIEQIYWPWIVPARSIKGLFWLAFGLVWFFWNRFCDPKEGSVVGDSSGRMDTEFRITSAVVYRVGKVCLNKEAFTQILLEAVSGSFAEVSYCRLNFRLSNTKT